MSNSAHTGGSTSATEIYEAWQREMNHTSLSPLSYKLRTNVGNVALPRLEESHMCLRCISAVHDMREFFSFKIKYEPTVAELIVRSWVDVKNWNRYVWWRQPQKERNVLRCFRCIDSLTGSSVGGRQGRQALRLWPLKCLAQVRVLLLFFLRTEQNRRDDLPGIIL